MSFDVLGDINWLAVVVAAIAYFAIGAAWYSPALLGKPWMRSIGWDAEQEPPAMTPVSYVGPLVGYLVAAAAVASLAFATDTDTFGEGIVLGLVVGIGVAAVLAYVTAVFDPQKKEPMTWFAITAGYHLVGLLVTAVVVALWT